MNRVPKLSRCNLKEGRANSDSSQPDRQFPALDADLLSRPFEIQTNWHVLTGAACTGKTTLINMLAEKGFQTAAETARQHIETELSRGRTVEEIFADRDTEPAIESLQRKLEGGLRAADTVFLDRALPDSITFRRIKGMNPNVILADCFHHRYASVFVLDRLPFQLDCVRIDDEALACYLDKWLARDYSALGYRVVRVPVLPPEDRLAFVLERLSVGV